MSLSARADRTAEPSPGAEPPPPNLSAARRDGRTAERPRRRASTLAGMGRLLLSDSEQFDGRDFRRTDVVASCSVSVSVSASVSVSVCVNVRSWTQLVPAGDVRDDVVPERRTLTAYGHGLVKYDQWSCVSRNYHWLSAANYVLALKKGWAQFS